MMVDVEGLQDDVALGFVPRILFFSFFGQHDGSRGQAQGGEKWRTGAVVFSGRGRGIVLLRQATVFSLYAN